MSHVYVCERGEEGQGGGKGRPAARRPGVKNVPFPTVFRPRWAFAKKSKRIPLFELGLFEMRARCVRF